MPRVWNKRDPKVPSAAVYVGRPTKWGNPWSHLPSAHARMCESREKAVELFREHLARNPGLRTAARRELRGMDLVCWCAPAACHADELLKIANAEDDE